MCSGTDKAILQDFGQRVRAARERHKWSQEELANRAGFDRSYVGGIERGERNISVLNLVRLATCLDEPLESLVRLPKRS